MAKCRKECLLKIQNKYKCVFSNLINEERLTVTKTQLTNLGYDLARQNVTLFSNLQHSERILFGTLVLLDKVKTEIPSLIPYLFEVAPNVGIIYIVKLGSSESDVSILENAEEIKRIPLPFSNIDEIFITLFFNLSVRNANIEQFRVTYDKEAFCGCNSSLNDFGVNNLEEFFFNFKNTTRYLVNKATYNDKYGLKFSTWTCYH